MALLEQKELNGRLKALRNQAREEGGLEYGTLKEAFADAELTTEQTGMIWDFLDRNCILVRNINEYDDFFRRVPESEPAGSELRTPGNQNAAAGGRQAEAGREQASAEKDGPAEKKAAPDSDDPQKGGLFAGLRKLFGGR